MSFLVRSKPVLTALILSLLAFAPAAADPFVVRDLNLPLPESWDVAAADFTGDGWPDLVALNSYGPFFFECNQPSGPIDCGDRMTVVLKPGLGLGRFGPPVVAHAMCLPWTVVAGDFDGDGTQDIVVGNRGARDAFGICFDASLSFFPGDGHVGFLAPHNLIVPDEPTDSAVGDIDGDGVLDVVVAFGDAGIIRAYHVSTSGEFVAGSSVSVAPRIGSIALGDLDGDGDLDLAVTLRDANQVALFRYDAVAGFQPWETCPATGQIDPEGVTIADLNGDGVPEIAVVNRNGALPNSSISLFFRGMGGSFCAPATTRTSSLGDRGTTVVAADLDGDGRTDLAVAGGSYRVLSLQVSPDGSTSTIGTTVTASSAVQIVSADLDRNGVADLVSTGELATAPTGDLTLLLSATPNPAGQVLDMGDSGQVGWVGVAGAVSYDVVFGDLGVLRSTGGDYTPAVLACLAPEDFPNAASLPGTPAPGQGWWVLGRPVFAGGPGSYDAGEPGQVGTRDPGINASPDSCP